MTKSRNLLSPRRFWTPADLAVLRALYPDLKASTVARELGRKVQSVHAKANELGLTKSAEFLASEQSGRISRGRTDERMLATQFKKGLRPWNTGTKGISGVHENTRRTQFKKGRKAEEAHNYVPIGTEQINKDGHLVRKVTDDPSVVPVRRWVPVYRLVWQEEHGPIPDGHMVVFRPGMRTTVCEQITVDRLECISLAENARRNHPRTKSPESAKLVQLKGAITRQVNRIVREAQEQQQ